MKLGAFQLEGRLPVLKEPHALAILRPWVDAGSAGTLVFSWLEARCKAKPLAHLARPGEFFDFTRYRPNIYWHEGQRGVSVPNTYISYGRHPSRKHDFLFLDLLEPHAFSEDYVESILKLLGRFGARRYILIGSMYDFVPHTRPLPVTGAALGEQAAQDFAKSGAQVSDYEGPTTSLSLVTVHAAGMGIETMTLIVHLPQYTQLEEDYMGASRLMAALGAIYSLPLDANYISKAANQVEQLGNIMADDPQVKAVVEQLEAHYDTQVREDQSQAKKEEESHLSPGVEKFLREMERRFRQGQSS
ncbi:MAG: PAC2 family protein [Chloroflexi bacterium]|nr:PAC2 family protein [Chloroflexota bacterium]